MAGWNVQFQAKGKAAARTELKKCSADMPSSVVAEIRAMISAIPETGLEGYNTLNVLTHGHFRDEEPGTSDCTILVQFMADPPEPPEEAAE